MKKHVEPITSEEYILALSLIAVLVVISGLVAGLTIGLMSLDSTNLAILSSSGTAKEKLYASRIRPIRKNGHLLLVTLLIVNTIINETLPILFDYIHLTGIQAILTSTLLVLIFGEIIPQAICNRHGLQIGAFFAIPVRILIILLYVVSKPIAMLLDWLLGSHQGVIYRHAELKELVSLHGEDQAGPLTKDEVSIVKAVLDLRHKTVQNIMTSLDNVFMLPVTAQMDSDTMGEILNAGHSRVPIYSKFPENIVGVVLVKQLILNQRKSISELKLRRLPKVHADTAIFEMLHIFEQGGSHMAIVVRPKAEGMIDFSSKSNILDFAVLGIVTLEDVIEELLGQEVKIRLM